MVADVTGEEELTREGGTSPAGLASSSMEGASWQDWTYAATAQKLPEAGREGGQTLPAPPEVALLTPRPPPSGPQHPKWTRVCGFKPPARGTLLWRPQETDIVFEKEVPGFMLVLEQLPLVVCKLDPIRPPRGRGRRRGREAQRRPSVTGKLLTELTGTQPLLSPPVPRGEPLGHPRRAASPQKVWPSGLDNPEAAASHPSTC